MAASSLGKSAIRAPRRYLVVAALIAWGCGLGSDSEDCDEQILPDVVEVRFVPALTEPGEYRLNFFSAVLEGTCDVSVGGAQLNPCDNAHLSTQGTSASGKITVATLRAWFDHGPAEFELTVSRGEDVLVTGSYEPQYRLEEPNGRGCGELRRAEVNVPIP